MRIGFSLGGGPSCALLDGVDGVEWYLQKIYHVAADVRKGRFFAEKEAAGRNGMVEWDGAHGKGVILVNLLALRRRGEGMKAELVGTLPGKKTQGRPEEILELAVSVDVEWRCSAHESERRNKSEEPIEMVPMEVCDENMVESRKL